MRQAYRFARKAYPYAKQGYQLYSAMRSGMRPRIVRGARQNTRSGVGITSQHDVRRQYRYKRMPRRKRRIWKRFLRKSRAALLKSVGTRTVLRNGLISNSTDPTHPQQFLACHLYGMNGTDTNYEIGSSDISDLLTNDVSVSQSGKIHFDTGIMDITFRNVPPLGELTSTRSMEVDVYDLIYRDETKFENLSNMIADAVTNTPPITAGTGIDIYTRGATLFDLPYLIKIGKIKILKKVKVFLPIGNTFTYQVRNPKNWVLNTADWNDTPGLIEPRHTRTVFAIFKPVVSAGGENPEVVRLDAGVTRKYKYKIIESDGDYDNVI